MACIQYITDTKIFIQTGQTDTNCNGVLFINTGTASVNIDGVVLQQGQQFRIDGNRDEMLVKTYSFTFATGTPQLTVVYKRYL